MKWVFGTGQQRWQIAQTNELKSLQKYFDRNKYSTLRFVKTREEGKFVRKEHNQRIDNTNIYGSNRQF